MKKKLLTILLSVFMIATSFTTNVFAEVNDTDVAKIGDTYYETLDEAFSNAIAGDTIDVIATSDETIDLTSLSKNKSLMYFFNPKYKTDKQDEAATNAAVAGVVFVNDGKSIFENVYSYECELRTYNSEGTAQQKLSATKTIFYGDMETLADLYAKDNKNYATNPKVAGNQCWRDVGLVKLITDDIEDGTRNYSIIMPNRNALNDENTLVVEKDIILSTYSGTGGRIDFRLMGADPFKFDLNGHEIYQVSGDNGNGIAITSDGAAALRLSAFTDMTIIDSKGSGSIVGSLAAIDYYGDYNGNGGKLTLESGKLVGRMVPSLSRSNNDDDTTSYQDDNEKGSVIRMDDTNCTFIMNGGELDLDRHEYKRVSETKLWKTAAAIQVTQECNNATITLNSGKVEQILLDQQAPTNLEIDYPKIIYRDVEATVDKTISNNVDVYPHVARIGNKEYGSLAYAIADVPADGTKTTITMIADETFKNINNPLIINKNQNVIIDLNSKTVKQEGTKIATESSAFITNNGTLTIDDYSVEKNGKLISNPSADNSYNAGHNTIANNSILNVINGTIEMQGSSGLFWAINNGSYNTKGVVANISGGKVINSVGYQAINLYAGHDNGRSQDVTVNISKNAIIESKSNVAIGLYAGGSSTKKANLSLNISDGTIKGNHGERAAIYVWKGSDVPSGCDYSNVRINITGGKFESNVNYIATWDSSDLATVTGLNKENIISAGIMNTEINDSEIAPGYTCIANKDASTKDTYHFMIGERTSGKVVIADTDNDVPEYYENISELQDAIDNLTKANEEKFEKNEKVNVSTIEVNGSGITAQIDDKVKIIADEGSNTVTADPGYKMNSPQTSGGKTTYTATALDIGKYVDNSGNVLDAPEETRGTKASEKISAKTNEEALQGVTQAVQESADKVDDTINNKQLGSIVRENLNTLLSNRGIHQGTAAKALNNAGIEVTNEVSTGTTKASDISVFVRTYYDTEVREDKTDEANKSYSLDITPMYQAYASTATSIGNMVAEGDEAASEYSINAVKIGESAPVDCTGKTINLKIELAEGFITNVNQKVYVIHTLADDITKKTYDTTVTKEGGKFYIEFTNPDGFSVFEITLKNPNPTPGPTPSSDPKPRYKIPNTGVDGTYSNNHSLLKLSSLSLLAIGTYLVIKKKKDN